MAERRYFGTDGVRGEVGTAPITADFVLRIGWAAGRVLARHSPDARSEVLIGKDTRISGYMFESVLEAGLTSAGIDVALLGPMPTPAIAYLTRTFKGAAGIVISASHNAYHDNGIKFFGADGGKLPDAVEAEIEAELDKEMVTVSSRELGRARRIVDAPGRYIEFCKSTVPSQLNFRGVKLVVDCANGATYNVAPEVFSELGADVIPLANKPDGFNINDGVGAVHPQALAAAVVEQGADLGVAFDGDGDRITMVDDSGHVVDGDELLFVLAEARQREGRLQGDVVGTVMSNIGLQEALAERDIGLRRTKVGDRYVLETMREHGCTLGGETSGHIICLDRVTTGDAIVAALQVLHACRQQGISLREARSGMRKFPQKLKNVRLNERCDVHALPGVADAIASAEAELGRQGRVLLRPSGTEPLVRVMVEGRDEAQVGRIVDELAAAVERALR